MGDNVQRLSGGCQCGAVRYQVTGEVGHPHLCHCRMCQKASGNFFLPLIGAAKSDFEWTRGEPSCILWASFRTERNAVKSGRPARWDQ